MTMPTAKKIETVQKLIEKLTGAKSVVLADYRGLTHHQLEELKRAVKKAKGEFVIAKNTLLKLASKQINKPSIENLTKDLTGPTGLLLSYEDQILPLKEIAGFAKQHKSPVFKIGVVEDKILTAEELTAVSVLPGKDVLLAQLTGQLATPLYRLQNVLFWNLQKLILTLKALENRMPSIGSGNKD